MIALGDYATKEQIAEARTRMGLDKPLPEQYVTWLASIARGDLGISFRNREAVASAITARLPATLELGLFALVLAVMFGLPAGVLGAVYRGRLPDYIVTGVALIGLAMPVFWIGLMLLMVFSVELNLLPTGGRSSSSAVLRGPTGFLVLDNLLHLDPHGAWEALRYLALPTLVLAWYPFATVARITRSGMLDVIRQDYIRTARSKGLGERRVITRHALKNALIPVVTVVGLSIGPLMGGAVLTEYVFSWPGLGRYTVEVVLARDFPAIQAVILLSAAVFTSVNVITDVVYAMVDPRIVYR